MWLLWRQHTSHSRLIFRARDALNRALTYCHSRVLTSFVILSRSAVKHEHHQHTKQSNGHSWPFVTLVSPRAGALKLLKVSETFQLSWCVSRIEQRRQDGFQRCLLTGWGSRQAGTHSTLVQNWFKEQKQEFKSDFDWTEMQNTSLFIFERQK